MVEAVRKESVREHVVVPGGADSILAEIRRRNGERGYFV
jgi:hypothetical protein